MFLVLKKKKKKKKKSFCKRYMRVDLMDKKKKLLYNEQIYGDQTNTHILCIHM